MVRVRVLFFAKAKEIVDQSEVEFELSDDSPTIVALMQAIVTEYPDIEPLCPGLVLSVNLDWISIRDSSVVLKALEVNARTRTLPLCNKTEADKTEADSARTGKTGKDVSKRSGKDKDSPQP